MKKKALIVASVEKFLAAFETRNMALLASLGYEVHIAASAGGTLEKHRKRLAAAGVVIHTVPVARNPLRLSNLAAYRQMRRLMERERFDLVHCHTPTGGVIGRLAARAAHIPCVLYTAHGFHFYKGAPVKNWLLYYPVEKLLAPLTDVLVTITRQDYLRAKKKLKAKRVCYVPGVGVDTALYAAPDGVVPGSGAESARSGTDMPYDRDAMRRLLGVPGDGVMLLCVGELNDNKNHAVLIRTLAEMNDARLRLVIAGTGPRAESLRRLAAENGVEERVLLAGYREDIPALLHAADVFLLPSLREGLNVSVMEAMCAALPCVCGDIRGNEDLIADGHGGFRIDVRDTGAWKRAIGTLADDAGLRKRFGAFNRQRVTGHFSQEAVGKLMEGIYRDCDGTGQGANRIREGL